MKMLARLLFAWAGSFLIWALRDESNDDHCTCGMEYPVYIDADGTCHVCGSVIAAEDRRYAIPYQGGE